MRSRTWMLAWMAVSALCALPAAAQSLDRRLAPPLRGNPADLREASVESLTVQARIVGRSATTRVDIVLANPNATVIESALQFPLREGQTVTGFALESLDRKGFLTAAPVEKAKGQTVFEQIVRGGADPALLEKTAGNNFKLRVYPIAPLQTRAVRLEISEFLAPDASGQLQYQMPQMLKEARPQKMAFTLELEGVAPSALRLGDGLKAATVDGAKGASRLSFSTAARLGGADYSLRWALADRVFTDYGSLDGENYFHAQIPLQIPSSTRKSMQAITLVWDASGSGARRDHAREFAFLDALFKAQGNVNVRLIETHVAAEAARNFEVRQGDWDALRSSLEKMPYDGASNAASWTAHMAQKQAGLTLLFSDGIANWGAPAQTPPGQTLYAIAAIAGSNSTGLRALAEANGGQFIDLLQTPAAEAVAELNTVRARLLRIVGDGADRLVCVSPYAQGGVLQIAGRLQRDSASLRLVLAMPDGSIQERSLGLARSGEESAVVAQRWATMRIAELEAQASLHQAEIQKLGSEFGVVSSRTSLIILERLEDYLRFEVMPSDPLWRAQYKQRMGERTAREAREQAGQMAQLLRKFEERIQWWRTDFPKTAKADDKFRGGFSESAPLATLAPPPPPAAAPFVPPREIAANSEMTLKRSADAYGASPRSLAQAPALEKREIAISVQKQPLDSAYARRLSEARAHERYAIYLDEKNLQGNNAAFYLDASEIFFEKGQPAIALRVLSNLAEIDYEDRALLRILAYRLQQAKQFDQAILLFKQVQQLAPDEPQSWRDLGLAYAANGQAQAAVDALWATASRRWDGRFADIDVIALAELNAIAAATPGLDLSRIDARLRRNLPVDLRVVLGWDADNTDIDLWVRDPNGEDAYYGHRLTMQGGRMSSDFTGGYGPEEFILKVAKPGRYEVRAKFFGSRQQKFSPYTTVMLRFTTGFGTARQKEQNFIMRLPERGSDMLVGSFEVK